MAQMQRVKVIRGFRHRREIQAPGSVLDLEMPIAIEMRTANKVEFTHQQTPLTHKTELPDPNRVMAERQAARATAMTEAATPVHPAPSHPTPPAAKPSAK